MPRRTALAVAMLAVSGGLLAPVVTLPAAGAEPGAVPLHVDPGSGALAIEVLSTIETGVYDASAAEIVAHDPTTQRLFVVNAAAGAVDVFDVDDPTGPTAAGTLDPSGTTAADGSTIPDGTTANSVDVRADGLVAVAIEAPVKTDDGWVALFTATGDTLGAVRVGPLPDMLTFTPDGDALLVANEGEPAEDFSLDPEGSVSVIDTTGPVDDLSQDDVRTADFRAYDDDDGPDLPDGVRVFGPDVPDADGDDGAGRIARNLEPEYIVVDADGAHARVVLQEANALAILDVAAAEIVDIQPLGRKDHALPGNELDASDRDPEGAPTVTIRDWPLHGIHMPDGAAGYEVDGRTYVVTANEGDAREWGAYVEPSRVKDLVLCDDADFGGYVGSGGEFADVTELQADEHLGRLNVSTAEGLRDGEDCYEELHSFGARSFSIWDEDGELVFDSGADFERITAALLPEWFNSNHSEANLEGRSDDKGPEPEDVAVAPIGDRTYAFVGFERIGGVIVYDVTDPHTPEFTTYVNRRDFTAFEGEDPTPEQLSAAGDLGAEGLIVIAAENSPLPGVPLLVVANEVSGTTTLFTVDVVDDEQPEPPTEPEPPVEPEPPALPTPPYDRGIAAACPGTYPATFDDVAGSVHEGAIRCAAAAGLTQGTSDPSRYAPRRTVTRAQMASFVARFLETAGGAPLPAGPDAFADDDGSVHEGAIDALAALGVVEGRRAGGFGPGDDVTRGQMASLLDRTLDVLDGDLDGSYPPRTDLDVFADDAGSVHAAAIDRLAVQGVVQGSVDGTFRPSAPVTRDQMATFLLRALDLAVTDDLADPVG